MVCNDKYLRTLVVCKSVRCTGILYMCNPLFIVSYNFQIEIDEKFWNPTGVKTNERL